jgi:hypothetical protein
MSQRLIVTFAVVIVVAIATWQIRLRHPDATVAQTDAPAALTRNRPLQVESGGAPAASNDPAPAAKPAPTVPKPPEPEPPPLATSPENSPNGTPASDSPEPLETPARKFARGSVEH